MQYKCQNELVPLGLKLWLVQLQKVLKPYESDGVEWFLIIRVHFVSTYFSFFLFKTLLIHLIINGEFRYRFC
jgi:hypothetical protein